YRKLGPVLLGVAEVHVLPDGGSSVLVWTEDVHVRGLSRSATAWLMRPVFTAMLRVIARRLAAEAHAGRCRRALSSSPATVSARREPGLVGPAWWARRLRLLRGAHRRQS